MKHTRIQIHRLMRSSPIILALALASVVGAGCQHYQPAPLSPEKSATAFDARSLSDPALRKFLEMNLGFEISFWPTTGWDFDSLTLAAFYFHPDLEVARDQWAVAKAGEKTAGGRPNPTVSVTPGYSVNPAAGTSAWFPGLAIDQPVETAGKRDKRLVHAGQLSEAARLNIFTAAWQVRNTLRVALIHLSDALKRKILFQAQLDAQEKLIGSLEQRVQAGALASYELTTARIAREKIRLNLDEAARQAVENSGRAAAAVGVPASALNSAAINFAWKVPADTELTTPEFRRQALLGRADVRGALADYAASQSALELEIAKQWPDVHLGTGYQFDQGENKFSLGLSAEIPVFNRNQGPILEAKARRAEAAARFIALQAKVLGDIDRAVAGYRHAQARLATLQDLRAARKKQRDALAAQVQAGGADRLDLLNLQVESALGELIEWDGGIKAMLAFAQLEDAIQRPLDLSAGGQLLKKVRIETESK